MSNALAHTFEDEEDAECPKGASLRKRYLRSSLSPGEYIGRLMLWNACSPRLRSDLTRRRCIVVIVEPPSRDWFDLIFDAARSLFPNCQFLSKTDAKSKSASQATVLQTGISAGQSVVVVTADDVSALNRALVTSADHHVQIDFPAPATIAATIRAIYGNRSVRRVPDIGATAPAAALVACLRPNENAGRVIARLIELERRATSKPVSASNGPTLEQLDGYGPAKDWGLDLARDMDAFRRRQIAWSDISSAAVLHGPPGTGKTLFAAALAQTCGVPLITTSLGRIFADTDGHLDDVVKGLSQSFAEARKAKPSILFIDELDSIPDRHTLSNRNRDWWSTVVNHFLKLLDDDRYGVAVLGATNMLGRIDPAILRAGRLERHFQIELPDEKALIGMLRLHLADRLADTDLTSIARLAVGATGADVALLVKRAAATARSARREIIEADLLDQLILHDDIGPDELWRICVHEAGHAVAALVLGRQVHHVTTVRRGDQLGSSTTELLSRAATRVQLEEHIIISLAGRSAEILLLGEACDGAEADLRSATLTAAAIHGSFGLGASIAHRAQASTALQLLAEPHFHDLIEAELRILDARSMTLMVTHQEKVVTVAEALRERRALNADQFLAVVRQEY
ncbi:AAA family ATPase [Bosea sp. (in: a-proteobacteria)]|uniref:AAA family ATPase n=1 Tax=Bosea sp. (in: a-proteobacteria) TaxID=1871050 RepID=UPI003F70FDD5